jgi:hypothetical protein
MVKALWDVFWVSNCILASMIGGGIIDFVITQANTDDRKPLKKTKKSQ